MPACDLRLALVMPLLSLAAAAHGAIHTFTPERDTVIFSESENATAAGGFGFAGYTAGGNERRALFRFDLESVAPGSRVVFAEFALTVDRTTGGPSEFSLHRLLGNWGTGTSDGGSGGAGADPTPGDATWTYRFFGDPSSGWTTPAGAGSPGGAFEATASATLPVGAPGTYRWSSSSPGGEGLARDVEEWIGDPAGNFGWILVGVPSLDRTAKRFYSADAIGALAGLCPVLTVEVVPVPEPGTMLFLLAGGIAVAARTRSAMRRVP